MNTTHKPTTLPKEYIPGFLASLDQRTGLAIALKDQYQSIVADLGGEGTLSRIQLVLVERACWLVAVLQGIENEIADGKKLRIR